VLLLAYFIKVFVALFAIVSPLSTIPAFLSMTPANTPRERMRMAKTACIVACIVLAVFAVAGQLIFNIMGITLPAFQIAGGILLFGIGYDMLHARESESKISEEERVASIEIDNIAITPLAVPLLAGPGAISTAILLQGEATSMWERGIVYACVPLVMIVSYYLFKVSAEGASWISPLVLKVIRRLTGLILAAMAVQFVVNGWEGLHHLG
jgi:multiple antibiotic resistance protein